MDLPKLLFAACRRPVSLRFGQLDKPPLDLGEQCRRQMPQIARFAIDCPHVRTRPDKPVAFRQHDPRALVVEPQAPFGRRRDFDFVVRIFWRAMGESAAPSLPACRRRVAR